MLIFCLCPEKHFTGFLFAHVTGFLCRIARKIIELNCVIENRTELIVDCFEIHRRERLAIFIGHFHHRVLPVYYVSRFDFVHAPASEIRKDFAFNDTPLNLPSVEFDAIFGVLLVELIESLKSHIEVSCVFEEEVLLPLGSFTLGLKASLYFAICFAFPVGISCGDIPRSVFVFVNRLKMSRTVQSNLPKDFGKRVSGENHFLKGSLLTD